MTEQILKFNVEQINIIEEISDEQLSIAEVWICHNDNNLHNLPISIQAIQNAIPTLTNKFLVAGFENGDFMGHEGKNQLILGFFPKDNDVRFAEKDGKQYLVANAIISKIYAEWAYDILCDDNYREVSMEIIVVDTEIIDNKKWITSFVFMGVTVLGLDWTAACPGSNIQITKFSTDQMVEQGEKAYHNYRDHFAKMKWEIPSEVKINAIRGLDLRKKYDLGGNSVSLSFARYVSKNDTITENKAKNYLKYFPKNAKELEFSDPPDKEYVNHMLFGGKEGHEWMQRINADMLSEKTKINSYFEDDKTNILSTQDKDTLEMGKEEETKVSTQNKEFTELTYRNKMDIIEKYITDNHADFYVCDISDNFVVIYDWRENFHFKVPYSISDGNVSLDMESKIAVINAWTEEFASNENTEGEQHMEKEMMSNNEDLETKETEFAESEKKDETSDSKEEDMGCKEGMSTDSEKEEEKKDDEDKEATMSADGDKDDKSGKDTDNDGDGEKKDEKESDKKEEMSAEEEKSDKEETKEEMSAEEKFAVLEKENAELKATLSELQAFKASIEKEKKDNIILNTLFDVQSKCPSMPQDEIDSLKQSSENFALDKIEDWKNMVYSKAFIFSNGASDNKKTTFTKIGLPFEKEPVNTKKGLWD